MLAMLNARKHLREVLSSKSLRLPMVRVSLSIDPICTEGSGHIGPTEMVRTLVVRMDVPINSIRYRTLQRLQRVKGCWELLASVLSGEQVRYSMWMAAQVMNLGSNFDLLKNPAVMASCLCRVFLSRVEIIYYKLSINVSISRGPMRFKFKNNASHIRSEHKTSLAILHTHF